MLRRCFCRICKGRTRLLKVAQWIEENENRFRVVAGQLRAGTGRMHLQRGRGPELPLTLVLHRRDAAPRSRPSRRPNSRPLSPWTGSAQAPKPTFPSPKAPLHSFAPRCAAISQKKPFTPGEATAKPKPNSTENCKFGRFSFFTRPDETNLLSTKLETQHDYDPTMQPDRSNAGQSLRSAASRRFPGQERQSLGRQ